MSLFFGPNVLAEIANFAADGSVEDLAGIAKRLAAYSKANAAAFMREYPRHCPAVVPVPAADIEARARLLSPALLSVLTNSGLLRCNAEDMDVATAADLATVCDRVLLVAAGHNRGSTLGQMGWLDLDKAGR